MSQPSDKLRETGCLDPSSIHNYDVAGECTRCGAAKPTEKRADELKIGDHVHDGRGIGPVELTHVQPHRTVHGDERVLIVTDDATVSYHPTDQMFPLATDAEVAEAVRQRDRVRAIAHIRALADWYEQHPKLPAPLSVDVRIAIDRENRRSNAELRAAIQEIAAAMGVEVEERDKTLSAKHTIAKWDPARVEIGATAYLVDEPEPEPEPEAATDVFARPPHYEAGGWKGGGDKGGCGVECACGTTFDGFDSLAEANALLSEHIKEGNAKAGETLDPNMPLDVLPVSYGDDVQPKPDCCEDCDAELDAAAEQTDGPAEALPVYADSVNGEEL